MRKYKVLTENAPRPLGPYSQAIVADNTIYVAGQGGFDPASGKLVNTSFEAEATQVFKNIQAILAAAGATMNDVVKVNIYLADLGRFQQMNAIYQQYFTEVFPARATVGAALLSGIQIEVECVAVKDRSE